MNSLIMSTEMEFFVASRRADIKHRLTIQKILYDNSKVWWVSAGF